MFSSANTPTRPSKFANTYRQIGNATALNGASPHKLISMLYDGFLDSVAQARGAMRERKFEAKGRAIVRAIGIVEDGLRGGLNLEAGGKLARDLDALYSYLTMRLSAANARNDEKALDECVRLIQPLRDAWKSIAGQVESFGRN